MTLALLLSCATEPLPPPDTLHEACLREVAAECACDPDTCPHDQDAACAMLDPATCAAGDDAACEVQAALAPLLPGWACWVVYYEETCDPYGDDCEGL